MTYRDAGVDVNRFATAQKSIGEIISSTHKLMSEGKVVLGLVTTLALSNWESCFALHSDGVGTKVLVAQLMNRFDTVGIDCVAMNVNDMICVGAQPVGFIDYIASAATKRATSRGNCKGAGERGKTVADGNRRRRDCYLAGRNCRGQ